MFFSSIISIAVASSAVVASPAYWGGNSKGCDLSYVRMSVPSNQTALVAPYSAPEYVTVGRWRPELYVSIGHMDLMGAVAALYDVSCLVGVSYFDKLAQIAFDLGPHINGSNAAHAKMHLPIVGDVEPLIDHFFVPNPVAGETGLSARFSLADTTYFTTLKKVASIDSPEGWENIPWLQLQEVDGTLASQVFRLNTVKGQPPSSCDAPNTEVLSVPYAAFYWFFE